jgi:hypothetical protein
VVNRTYADVKPQGIAGWLAVPCGSGAPAMPAFAAQAMTETLSDRHDAIVRPKGPFGGSTG